MPTEKVMKKVMTAIAAGVLLLGGAGAFAQGDVAAGKDKSAPCAACHGADGNSPSDPSFPILAGQYADYLVKALEDYQSGKRKNAIMSGFAAPLSKRDREDLAAYYASQKGPLTTIKSTR